MGKFIDLTGQKFNRWKVINRGLNDKAKNTMWHCICDCGNECIVRSNDLRYGKTRSCGCLQKEEASERLKKHGKHDTRLYVTWCNMKHRCYNEKADCYIDYGGRGITVCDEWRDDFQLFYDWAMANGYNDGLEIDREDNNGNYTPENCRWVNNIIQNRNQRIRKDNTSGVRGVYWNKKERKWCARISVNNKSIYLGDFENIDEAANARKQAEIKYWN